MPTVTVAIPTLKSREVIQSMIDQIMKTVDPGTVEVIASCIDQSASKNRNWCIDNANG